MNITQVQDVLDLHAKREGSDGYGMMVRYCVEDRQIWPCQTVKALRCNENDGTMRCALAVGHDGVHHG